MRMLETAPFRDLHTDQRLGDETHRCNSALFEDWRYRALTDRDLACITVEIRGYADGIRKRVSVLRNALWEELDREQGIPNSPTMKDADEVDAFFRSDCGRGDRAWRKMKRRLTTTPEGSSEWKSRQADPPVRLNGPDEKVILWGKPKPRLAPAQYAVVKLLVEAYNTEERLSKSQLENRAKDGRGNTIEDPVGALERLCRKDRDWRQAIDMAKVAGRGYQLNDRPGAPTTTHKTANQPG